MEHKWWTWFHVHFWDSDLDFLRNIPLSVLKVFSNFGSDSDSLEYKHDEWYFPIFEMKTKRNWVKCDQWWCITSGEGRLHQSEWGWAIHPKRGSPGNYLDFPQSCSLRMRKLPNLPCGILSQNFVVEIYALFLQKWVSEWEGNQKSSKKRKKQRVREWSVCWCITRGRRLHQSEWPGTLPGGQGGKNYKVFWGMRWELGGE